MHLDLHKEIYIFIVLYIFVSLSHAQRNILFNKDIVEVQYFVIKFYYILSFLIGRFGTRSLLMIKINLHWFWKIDIPIVST